MTFDEYIANTDTNKFWLLKSGDHQNLLDEAIDRLEEYAKKRDDMQKDKLEAAKVLLDELRTKCTSCEWYISLKMVDAVALIVEAIEE